MHILIVLFGILPVIPGLSYKNNEMCPKEIQINLTRKQNEQLQYELLVMLGVSARPNRIPDKKLKSSSKFLLDVYKYLKHDQTIGNRITRRSVLELSEEILEKVQTSDVIVTLNNLRRKSTGKYQKLTFSMKNFPETSSLIGAELKLYQDKISTFPEHAMYKIYVYMLFETVKGPVKLKKIAEKISDTEYVGWISIDISYLFSMWLETKGSLKEIYLSVYPFGVTYEESEPYLSSIGLILGCETCENQPFIVSYLKHNNKLLQVNLRLPRNTFTSKKADFTKMYDIEDDSCTIFPYKVSFKELMWQDWIIAPTSFPSSFCDGRCKFPLKYPMKATNHALIQNLIHIKNPEVFPEPICAPTQLDPLTILYREGDNTILKKYNDMLVTSCGCH